MTGDVRGGWAQREGETGTDSNDGWTDGGGAVTHKSIDCRKHYKTSAEFLKVWSKFLDCKCQAQILKPIKEGLETLKACRKIQKVTKKHP